MLTYQLTLIEHIDSTQITFELSLLLKGQFYVQGFAAHTLLFNTFKQFNFHNYKLNLLNTRCFVGGDLSLNSKLFMQSRKIILHSQEKVENFIK